MKQCGSCKQLKDFSSFHKKEDSYQSRCKECVRKYHRRHYLANKNRYKNQAYERKIKLREIIAIKKAVPCKDCGIKYPPYVMDFDHIKGSKIRAVGRFTNHGSKKALLAEIEKCEVVCSNCHRIRTHNRNNGG